MDRDFDESRLDELLERWEEQFTEGEDLDANDLCPDDPRLAEALQQHIEALRAMKPLVDAEPPTDDDRGLEPPGAKQRPPVRSLMTYEGLRFHARGGLGEVYRANDDALGREVAIKFIQEHHAEDPESRRRFSWEAQVTSRLEHPGVIPIHGIGQDEGENPCYLMPFVRGQTFKDAIDAFHAAAGDRLDRTRHGKEFRALLGRFRSVCATVAYAHSRGILHRDLKPSNVMLGAYDETFVVDWGLAKAMTSSDPEGKGPGWDIHPEGDDGENPTKAGSGTPGFMSPEQQAADWERVSQASDIYGLGATLYVLLTGRRAFRGSDIADVMQKVARGDYPRPRDVKKGVPPALEAICTKAMALRPEDRYASVLQMAADIENWLADEPVSAHREPWTARTARWARKHRTITATVAAIVLVGLIGLVVFWRREATNSARLARSNAETQRWLDQAMTSYEEYLAGFNEDAIRSGRLPRDLLESLLDKPARFYRQFTEELARKDNPTEREQARLAWGYLTLGRIQALLGLHPEALQSTSSAISLYRSLAGDHPDVAEYRHRLAAGNTNLGLSSGARGDFDTARESYQEAIDLLDGLTADYPDRAEFKHMSIGSLNALCFLHRRTGDVPGALEAVRRAVEVGDILVAEHPNVSEYRDSLARSYVNLGAVRSMSGDLGGAIEAIGKGVELREGLVANRPDDPDARHGLATSHQNLGIMLAGTGAFEKARDAFQTAIDLWETLVDEQANVPEYQNQLAFGFSNLGNVLQNLGELSGSGQAYRRAIELRRALVLDHPDIPDFEYGLAQTLVNLGHLLTDDEPEVASENLREAISVLEPLLADHPEILDARIMLAGCHTNLGNTLRNLGDRPAARAAYEDAVERFEMLARDHPTRPEIRSQLGATIHDLAELLAEDGRLEEADVRYREAIVLQKAILDELPQMVEARQSLSRHYEGLSRSLRKLGRFQEAVGATRDRIGLWPDNPSQLYDAACELSRCVSAMDGLARDDDRDRIAEEAIDTLRRAILAGWDDPHRTATDPDLAPLRDDPEFQALIAEMQGDQLPSMPFSR